MKRILLPLLLMLTIVSAWARPVGEMKARLIALRVLPEAVNITPSEWDEVYLFTTPSGRGFALVSADDCTRPLIAYSTTDGFRPEEMPWHVQVWIDGYRREIAELRAAGAQPTPEVQQQWIHPSKGIGKSVPMLIELTWDQAPYYNQKCPYSASDSANAVTGCVATAQAQIMKYWNHPTIGHGEHSYKPEGFGYQYVNYNSTYQWDKMPNALNWSSSQEEIDAVALLMYHIGVGVEMNYGVGSSGAQVFQYGEYNLPSSERSLKEHFRYSSLLKAVGKSAYSDHDWDSLLRFEIDHARPVLYSGFDNSSGHAFVLDGYDTMGMFHVNWGWSGWYNGYYTTDSLSPGAGGIGGNATYTFNLNNGALTYIMPAYGEGEVATIDVHCDDPKHGFISGNGDYTPYSTTVDVLAVANEGYRFDHWASEYPSNPVQLYVNGGYTDTAIFVPLGRDTIAYCTDKFSGSWQDDYGSTTEWGISIPALRRNPSRSLSAVQLYVNHPGYYTLNIYFGDEIQASNRIYTHQHNMTQASGWTTIQLDEALPLVGDKTLWITFRHNSNNSFPAAYSAYGGVADGSWYHLPDGWVRYSDEGIYTSWMIRALFEERDFYVDVQLANDHLVLDQVVGAGEYAAGETCTLHYCPTCPDEENPFMGWVIGESYIEQNPYSFTVTQDTIVYAIGRQLGIENADDAGMLHATVVGHTLLLEGTAAPEAQLYSLEGRLIGRGSRYDQLATGVYLLHAPGLTLKKIVIL